jgi:hypothetical protein
MPGRRRQIPLDFERRWPWLLALVCGLFGLSVLMLALLLVDGQRPVGRGPTAITGPAPVAVVPANPAPTTAPAPSRRPRPAPATPEPRERDTAVDQRDTAGDQRGSAVDQRDTTGDQRDLTEREARELAERYMSRIPGRLPGPLAG